MNPCPPQPSPPPPNLTATSPRFPPTAGLRLNCSVLKAVEEQCGLYGDRLVQLSVDELESDEISRYCRLLSELGLIEITTYKAMEGDYHYPIRLTADAEKLEDMQSSIDSAGRIR